MSDSPYCEESIFQKCLELPPEERDAFLKTTCGVDAHLRIRVQTLLKSHESAAGFFDTFLDEDSAAIASQLNRIAPSEERAGDKIGRYELLEKLGEGAWGTVWKARQTEDIKRKVALKILKLGLDTKEFLARFEAERQILALMDHPNIARVIDAGSTDYGRPYMVMELVEGVPLLEYADRHTLKIKERVALFAKICSAMEHAHEKGIIHRDLKPTNILVSFQGDEAFPKVIDFGVAKSVQSNLTDKTLQTSVHSFIGTPVYSSPEQLEFSGVEMGPRSDVYSLGVLLFELLCGKTPYECDQGSIESIEAFRAVVREKEAQRLTQYFSTFTAEEKAEIASRRGVKPSQVESRLNGDLEWIVLKCLEKDPSMRYPTAELLAQDLEGYLNGVAVSAVPPSLGYRIGKAVTRRSRRQLVLEMAVAALVVLAAFLFFRSEQTSGPGNLPVVEAVPAMTGHSIAVLPLIDLDAQENESFIAADVYDEIVSKLAQEERIQLASRSSSLRAVAVDLPVKELAASMNVSYLIEGSIRRVGSSLRASVHMVDALHDRTLWSQVFVQELAEGTMAEAELAEEICESVVLELKSMYAGPASLPPANPVALDLFLKAESIERSVGETEEGMERRQYLLEQAVDEDPEFVEAWGALKRVYALMATRVESRVGRTSQNPGWYVESGENPASVAVQLRGKEQEALERAMELNPNHLATRLATVVDHDWPKSEENMATVKVTLDELAKEFPGEPYVWYHLGWWYANLSPRDYPQALRAFEQAMSLDPFNARIIRAGLVNYANAGEEENANQLAGRLSQIVPDEYVRPATGIGGYKMLQPIREAFAQSGDVSLIKDYEENMEIMYQSSHNPYLKTFCELYLHIFKDDYESAMKSVSFVSVEDYPSWAGYEVLMISFTGMRMMWNHGEEEAARDLARKILQAIEPPEIKQQLDGDAFLSTVAPTCLAMIGRKEEAASLIQRLVNRRSSEFDPYGSSAIRAMSWLDRDRAVEMFVAVFGNGQNGQLLGEFAAFYPLYAHFLNEPAIEDIYREDGVWVDYLTARSGAYK